MMKTHHIVLTRAPARDAGIPGTNYTVLLSPLLPVILGSRPFVCVAARLPSPPDTRGGSGLFPHKAPAGALPKTGPRSR